MNYGLYALGALIAFTPQLGAWHIIYGTWLTIPQGSDYMQWTSPRLMYALFSLRNGLFVWSPILLLAVWGLLKLKPSHLRWSVLLALAVQIYINSCTRDFAGIGLRRMVDYTPLFAVGLVVAFMVLKERGQRHLILLASVAAITFNWAMTIGLYLIQWLLWGEFHFL